MRNKKSFWIPLAGSMALLLLAVLTILPTSGAPSLAADSPQSPAEVEGIDSWTWRGPSHDDDAGLAPQVSAIVMEPGSPSTVYAATNQGVYRSEDTGNTWQPRNQGLGGYGGLVITDLEIDPTNHQRLVISTWGYGLSESTDGGLHWARLADPLASADLQPSAAPDPAVPQVRVGGVDDTKPTTVPDLLKKPPSSGVLPPQPEPAGEEQVASPQALPEQLPWTPVRDVAIHPSNPNQLFACIDWDSGGGLYVSSNGGDSWSPVSLGTANCHTYTFAPSDSDIRYASFGKWAATGGFYRTTNGGDSWTNVGEGNIEGTVTAVAIHPTNPDFVLAATSDDGLYRSANGGDSWTKVSESSSLEDIDFYSVAFAPGNPSIAYAGGYYKVYRSADGGATWAPVTTSFPREEGSYIKSLAIHPGNSSIVLLGAGYFIWGGVYKRTNEADPFVLVASGMTDTFVLDIEQDPSDPNVLYAATWGAGALRSGNGGLTWDWMFWYPYITCLEATEGSVGTVLYAGTFYHTYGIYKSWDQGGTWQEIGWGYEYDSEQSLDIKSLDGGDQNLVAATGWGVEYSTDGAETWNNATGLSQGLVLKLAQSPTNPNWLMAATFGGGVWSSTNGGSDWVETSTGLDTPYVYDVAFAPWDSNTAYAASLGVYRTANGGGSWSLSGLSGTHVRSLATRGAPGYDVFAGTVSRGVFMAPDRSNLWLDLNEGLGELRTLSLMALDYDTLFTGTNGRGAWEYTIVNKPQPLTVYLPVVLRNYSPPVPVVPLINGDFEQGPTVGWEQYADHGYNIILNDDPLPVDAHSGSWLTWLGGAYDNLSVIWQDATIPASDPVLRFYHWDASQESTCGNDYGLVFINGSVVAGWNLCISTNTGGWAWGGVDLSAYAGQTVEVAIGAYTNSSLNSNSFIDDVTLGYFGSPDLGVQEAPLVFDESALLQMITDLGSAQRFTSEPPFRPSGIPSDLPGLVDLSD